MNDNKAPLAIYQDPEAWQAGFKAGRNGKPYPPCPYAHGTDESLGWSSGLIEGAARRLNVLQSDER